jgi:Transglutaminase-like superfamily
MRDKSAADENLKSRTGLVTPKSAALAGLCALFLAAGWIAGFQHKSIIVRAKNAKADFARGELAVATAAKAAKAAEDAIVRPVWTPQTLKDLDDIRLLTERLEPRLVGETSNLRKAQLLRNLVYSRIAWVTDPGVRYTGYKWLDLADAYRKSMLDPTYGHMCAGRSIVYLISLRAFGVPARKVGMVLAAAGLSDAKTLSSHASVEVLVDGQWIAQDPTFNFSLADSDGRAIGWVEAAKIVKDGKDIVHRLDGFDVSSEHSIETYGKQTGLTLKSFLGFVNTSPHWDGTSTRAGIKFPDGWDGHLRFTNGTATPIFANNAKGILHLLSRPPG